jgi:hypothetical protein
MPTEDIEDDADDGIGMLKEDDPTEGGAMLASPPSNCPC